MSFWRPATSFFKVRRFTFGFEVLWFGRIPSMLLVTPTDRMFILVVAFHIPTAEVDNSGRGGGVIGYPELGRKEGRVGWNVGSGRTVGLGTS